MEYVVVLVAALFHAIWNSIVKDSGDRLITLGVIRATGMLFGLFVVFFLPPLERQAIPYLIGASFIHLIYFWFLLNTYRVGDFSQVYPIARGSAPLIVLLMGTLFAGEFLSTTQAAATLIISLGILSLSFTRGRLSVIPVSYALGTALCIAGYTLVSGIGVRLADSFVVYAGWLETFCGLGYLPFALLRRKGQVLIYFRTQWKQGMLAGIAGLLSFSGFGAALWAMTISPLAPIAALRETSIIFAAIIGSIVFKEGKAKHRISSACIVVIGIAILITYT